MSFYFSRRKESDTAGQLGDLDQIPVLAGRLEQSHLEDGPLTKYNHFEVHKDVVWPKDEQGYPIPRLMIKFDRKNLEAWTGRRHYQINPKELVIGALRAPFNVGIVVVAGNIVPGTERSPVYLPLCTRSDQVRTEFECPENGASYEVDAVAHCCGDRPLEDIVFKFNRNPEDEVIREERSSIYAGMEKEDVRWEEYENNDKPEDVKVIVPIFHGDEKAPRVHFAGQHVARLYSDMGANDMVQAPVRMGGEDGVDVFPCHPDLKERIIKRADNLLNCPGHGLGQDGFILQLVSGRAERRPHPDDHFIISFNLGLTLEPYEGVRAALARRNIPLPPHLQPAVPASSEAAAVQEAMADKDEKDTSFTRGQQLISNYRRRPVQLE